MAKPTSVNAQPDYTGTWDDKSGATETKLAPEQEKKFQAWKKQVAPNDSGEDYDFRGAYLAGATPGPDGHWVDTFKKPNHPTFSNESKYADKGNPGHWEGEKFVPGVVSFKEDEKSPIIDISTGKRVRVPEKELSNLILDGKVGYAPEHRVNIRDQNGQSYSVTGDYLKHALSKGFTLETSAQTVGREFADKHKGLSGDAKQFLKSFVDEATFGFIGAIEDGTANEYDRAKKEALAKEHEFADISGKVAGFATSMLYGGEVTGATKAGAAAERLVLGTAGKVAAERLAEGGIKAAGSIGPSLARKVAANALKAGVENVAFVMPKAITEASLGEPEKAGEHLLIAFGGGAAFGAAGKLFGETVAPIGKNLAESQATKSHFLSSYKKGQRMIDALPGGSKGYGRRMLDDDLLRRTDESFDDLLERIVSKKNETGGAIGNLYGELDRAGSKVKLSSTDELADLFEHDVIGELKKTPGNENIISKVKAYTDSFRKTGEGRNLSFQELHNWRAGLDDKIWNEGQIGIQDSAKKALAKVRDRITNELETKGELVAKEMGGSFKKDLSELNLKYRQYKTAEHVVSESATRQKTNATFSLTDNIGGAAVTAARMASGDPFAILEGLAGTWAKKHLRENGNTYLAKIADRIGMNSKGAAVLRYGLRGGDKAGILMGEKALADAAHELDKIPSILDSLSVKNKARQAVVRTGTRIVDDLLLSDAVHVMKSSGELQDNIDALSSIISDQGAPEVGKAYAAKMKVAADYLLDEMPKPPPISNPYRSNKAEIPKTALSRYARKVEVVNNPYSVLEHIKNGTLTDEHVHALISVYPQLTDEFLRRIDDHAASGNMQPLAFTAAQNIEKIKKMRRGRAVDPNPVSHVKFGEGAFAKTKQPRINTSGFKSLPGTQLNDADRVMLKGIGKGR